MMLVFLRTAALSFVLGFCLAGASALAASAAPDLLKTKREAEAKGYIFETSHDEIVAKARKEGKLRVLTSLDPESIKALSDAFKKKYPFIDTYVEELTGTEAAQRFLLELQSGTTRNWDVGHAGEDTYSANVPYVKKFHILGMAEHNVLAIQPKMVDPDNWNVVALGGRLWVSVYNKNLISADKVPSKWEDFLKPEFKDKKFLAEIRPLHAPSFVVGMGEERVKEYSKNLAAQKPLWIRGNTRALTAMASGEYSMFFLTYYNSVIRAMRKDPTKSLAYKVIEPVPAAITEPEYVIGTAPHPHAALLWLEFAASSQGQKIIDEYEPVKASFYVPGTEPQKVIAGKKVWLHDWKTYEKGSKQVQSVIEAYGFPKAQK